MKQQATPEVVRPVVITTPTAKPPKQHKSFHQYLEALMGPMGIIFALSMAVKSSYFWTLHLLDYSQLPQPLPEIINAASGLAIAFSLEIIGVAAAGKAYRMLMEKYNVALKDSIKKEHRKATETQFLIQFWVNLTFAVFGLLGSSAALIVFAGDHVQGHGDSTLGEIIAAVALQLASLYIGVFHEPSRPDPLKALGSAVYDSVGGAYKAFGDKLANGTATNDEIKAMQKAMSPNDRSLLDSLIKSNSNGELWDSTAIANFLMSLARWPDEKQYAQFDTVQHNVTSRMRKNQDVGELGIAAKTKGRGLTMPAEKAFLLFFTEIETAKANGVLFAHRRKATSKQTSSVQVRNDVSIEQQQSQDVASIDRAAAIDTAAESAA